MAAVQATMDQFGEKTAAEIAAYSDAELAVIDDFLTRMAAVTRDEANALRDTPDREAGAQSEYAAPIGGLDRARLLFKSGANELLIRGVTGFDDLYRATLRRAGPAGPAARRRSSPSSTRAASSGTGETGAPTCRSTPRSPGTSR